MCAPDYSEVSVIITILLILTSTFFFIFPGVSSDRGLMSPPARPPPPQPMALETSSNSSWAEMETYVIGEFYKKICCVILKCVVGFVLKLVAGLVLRYFVRSINHRGAFL